MVKKFGESPFVAVFWLVALVETIVIWKTVSTTAAQVALICMLVLSAALTYVKRYELPLLASIFTTVIASSYWQTSQSSELTVNLVIVLLIVTSLGLLKEILEQGWENINNELIGQWLLLGLISAEMVSFFSSWQVSFFNRSLFILIIFYLFWRLFDLLNNQAPRRELISHFLFVGATAIVVIGIIIWSNFPKLILF
jgi:hypothetical protein